MLITEVGNALGYVRMVRSAGMKCCSDAIQYVPDIQTPFVFEPLVGEGGGRSKASGSADSDGDAVGKGGDADQQPENGASLSKESTDAARMPTLCAHTCISMDASLR